MTALMISKRIAQLQVIDRQRHNQPVPPAMAAKWMRAPIAVMMPAK